MANLRELERTIAHNGSKLLEEANTMHGDPAHRTSQRSERLVQAEACELK
jgi:hypothetical protein